MPTTIRPTTRRSFRPVVHGTFLFTLLAMSGAASPWGSDRLAAQEPPDPDPPQVEQECVCLPGFDSEQLREMRDRARGMTLQFRRGPGPSGPVMPARPFLQGFLGGGVLGVRVTDLNPSLGGYFGAERGALVLEVDEASEADLRPGDVILAVDGREVQEAQHLHDIVRSYRPEEEFTLSVLRESERIEVTASVQAVRMREMRARPGREDGSGRD